jgi:NADH-quinone oxidoreductase subunit E
MFKRENVGRLIVSVCTNIACFVNGGPALFEHLRRHYASDDDVLVEEVECLAACDLAPVLQVNYEFHGPLTGPAAVDLVEGYRSGALTARSISGTRGGGGS